jgi:hypothetical protein
MVPSAIIGVTRGPLYGLALLGLISLACVSTWRAMQSESKFTGALLLNPGTDVAGYEAIRPTESNAESSLTDDVRVMPRGYEGGDGLDELNSNSRVSFSSGGTSNGVRLHVANCSS